MKNRICAILLLVALILSAFTGCGGRSDVVTAEQAQKIALADAGLSADAVSDIHTHVTDQNGIPCFSVHITMGDTEYSYIISAADGQILSAE